MGHYGGPARNGDALKFRPTDFDSIIIDRVRVDGVVAGDALMGGRAASSPTSMAFASSSSMTSA